jgi:hypothetical protein
MEDVDDSNDDIKYASIKLNRRKNFGKEYARGNLNVNRIGAGPLGSRKSVMTIIS